MEDSENIPSKKTPNDQQSSSLPREARVENPERKRSVEELIAFGKEVLAGRRTGDLAEYTERPATGETSEGPPEEGDPVILDTKKDDYSPEEQRAILDWIEEELGSSISDALIGSEIYQSPDGGMQIRIIGREFGTSKNPWRLVQVVDINES